MQNNESEVRQLFRKKWVWSMILVDLLVVVAIIGVAIWNSMRSVTLIINVAPIDANVRIGLSSYQNGTYKVHPGTYEMVISREGLESKTLILNLEAGSAVNAVAYLKGADDNFDFYTWEDNSASFRKLAKIINGEEGIIADGDYSAKKFVADFQKKLNSEIRD